MLFLPILAVLLVSSLHYTSAQEVHVYLLPAVGEVAGHTLWNGDFDIDCSETCSIDLTHPDALELSASSPGVFVIHIQESGMHTWSRPFVTTSLPGPLHIHVNRTQVNMASARFLGPSFTLLGPSELSGAATFTYHQSTTTYLGSSTFVAFNSLQLMNAAIDMEADDSLSTCHVALNSCEISYTASSSDGPIFNFNMWQPKLAYLSLKDTAFTWSEPSSKTALLKTSVNATRLDVDGPRGRVESLPQYGNLIQAANPNSTYYEVHLKDFSKTFGQTPLIFTYSTYLGARIYLSGETYLGGRPDGPRPVSILDPGLLNWELHVNESSSVSHLNLDNSKLLLAGGAYLNEVSWKMTDARSEIVVEPKASVVLKDGLLDDMITLKDGLLELGHESNLTFEDDGVYLQGQTLIFNPSSGTCRVNLPLLYLRDLGSIVTDCDLHVAGIVPRASSHEPILLASRANRRRLTIDEFPTTSYALNLTNFGIFSTPLNPSNDTLIVYGDPIDGIHLQWPVSHPEPQPDVLHPLWISVPSGAAENKTVPAVFESGDLYAVNITYTVRSDGQMDVAYSRYTGPPPSTNVPTEPPQPVPNSPPSAACPPPPPGFVCSPSGYWISNTSVASNGSIIVAVPVVTVNGNLTVTSGSLILTSGAHNITILGCLNLSNGSGIVIDLSQQPGKRGPVQISQADNCSLALNGVPISVKQPKNSCETINARTTSTSSRSTLNVLFVTDKSGCNKKWIILGSVLAAIIILSVIGVIIAFVTIKGRNEKLSRASIRS